jgi:uncharacterized membrane protein YhiD involved in acid resistance
MLQELEQIAGFSLSAEQMTISLLIALLCGVLVAAFYRASYRGRLYSPSFAHALVLLSMITTMVIMVIGSNLARAFGLVGAMAIIRFRTAVKDTQEIIFIFFALAAGMAAGAGLALVALAGTVAVGLTAVSMSRLPLVTKGRSEFLLTFLYSGAADTEGAYLGAMKKHCRGTRLLNMRSLDAENAVELSFHVRLRDGRKASELLQDLRAIESVQQLNLYFDEEHS